MKLRLFFEEVKTGFFEEVKTGFFEEVKACFSVWCLKENLLFDGSFFFNVCYCGEILCMRKWTNICIALASVSVTQADSKILDFDAIHRYFCLIKLFKYLKLIESDYFKNRLSSLQITHGIETRSNANEKN